MRTNRPEIVRLILDEFPGWKPESLQTREKHLAFWINTYNALVAEGITALGIRQSVWEVPGFFDRISYRMGDLVFNANEIEHGVLRGNRPYPPSTLPPFEPGDSREAYVIVPPDPRIHFAISCGASCCPPTRTYHPDRLHEDLDWATREFVNREVKLEGNTLVMPSIFYWFLADFDDFLGGLAGFLAWHLDRAAVRQAVLNGGLSCVVWRPYDRGLQRQ